MISTTTTESSTWSDFVTEIETLGHEMRTNSGKEDFLHLRKMERWGWLATIIGYGTAWISLNPFSVILISLGIFTRWALVFHPVSHGAFDRIPNIPARYTSRKFAKGYRRFFDWFDWMTPGNWHDEHNKLHHYHLGTDKDPDVVWRNAAQIRSLKVPYIVRYFVALVIACIWKPFYYAPNTVAESRHQRRLLKSNRIGWNNWNPITAEGRELWFQCLLPYIGFRFLFLPLLFFPLGQAAVISVLANSIFAEILTNLHGFITIAPNHTGDDVATFSRPSKGRSEFYYRQIVGTINFPSHNEFTDFLYGGMNYQIEHHLWPKATLLQYQRVRPKLKSLCAKYEIPYKEFSVWPRVNLTLKTIAGPRSMATSEPRMESELK